LAPITRRNKSFTFSSTSCAFPRKRVPRLKRLYSARKINKSYLLQHFYMCRCNL
jgi:hypothetical protein